MPGSPTRHDYLPQIRDCSAGEGTAWGQHWRELVPRGIDEIEAECGGGRRRAVHGKRAGVEEGPTENVEVGPQGYGSEVAEAVHVGVAGHGRERTPGEILRIKEVRRGDGRVLRKDAEEVVEMAEMVTEGN